MITVRYRNHVFLNRWRRAHIDIPHIFAHYRYPTIHYFYVEKTIVAL